MLIEIGQLPNICTVSQLKTIITALEVFVKGDVYLDKELVERLELERALI